MLYWFVILKLNNEYLVLSIDIFNKLCYNVNGGETMIILMICWLLGWFVIIPCCAVVGLYRGFTNKPQLKPKYKKSKIDSYGDKYYGTIDWLSKGNL